MKKVFITSVVLSVAILFCSCGSKKINTITVNEKADDIGCFVKGGLVMREGVKYTVNATPKYKEDIVWSTANKKIATVDDKGNVTAIKKGITVITASTKTSYKHIGVTVTSPNGFIMQDDVVLRNKESDIESIEIAASTNPAGRGEATIKKGEKVKLVAFTDPSDSKDKKKIDWETSDKKIVKINEKTGEIEAVETGNAVIKAYAPNGIFGTYKVRVR